MFTATDRALQAPDQEDLAILVAMTTADEHLPLATVKNRLSEVVDRVEREHGRVVITKHGRPAAVVMSVEDLESLEETLSILSDPKLMRRIRKAEAEIAAGEAEELTADQALALASNRTDGRRLRSRVGTLSEAGLGEVAREGRYRRRRVHLWGLADNPQRVGRALHLELAGLHAARRGDFRVAYRIDESLRRLTVLLIDHRADVYRRR